MKRRPPSRLRCALAVRLPTRGPRRRVDRARALALPHRDCTIGRLTSALGGGERRARALAGVKLREPFAGFVVSRSLPTDRECVVGAPGEIRSINMADAST